MEEINILHTVLNLGPSGILGFISWKLWGSYQEQLKYSREQALENLKSITVMMNLLDKVQSSQGSNDETTHTLIKEFKATIDRKIDLILDKLSK
jgi:hypothetical protein